MSDNKPIVFISCGQRTDDEKNLGAAIVELVKGLTAFSPYFAEEQTTLEGLTNNIFAALNRAAGFIAIMHDRGQIASSDQTRASVWVEQEIAISAFLHQTLGREIHIAVYQQPKIALEGVRSQLLLNAIEFESNEQIIEHLKKVLPTWTVPEEPHKNPLIATVNYKKQSITQKRHDYQLVVLLTNTGDEPIANYQVDLEFPNGLVEKPEGIPFFVPDRTTDSYLFFRIAVQDQAIYQGDSRTIFELPYFVDQDIFAKRKDLLGATVRATIYVQGFSLRVVQISMAELQVF
jgi:hypothetical protein